MKQTEVSKKKETVRISKKDLLKLLSENEHMTKQISELQGLMNGMLEEIRALKAQEAQEPHPIPSEDFSPAPIEELEITPKELTPEDIENILKPHPTSHPHYPNHRNDIFFDGSYRR